KDFVGVVESETNECLFFIKTASGGAQKAAIERHPLTSPHVKERLGSALYDQLLGELELLNEAGNPFNEERFLSGQLTPVFFASALTNFGIEPFFDAFIHLAPSPHGRVANKQGGGEIAIDVEMPFSAYVFKLQANMDKRHRDSMAFLRICSGRFERDMSVKHHRLGREIRLSRPHGMVAGERSTLDCAYPGDIIGVINPGVFAIGDTISLTGGFNYKPL
ncbi:MAG: peptide chain release factor 3, partial [Chlamydiia bacterium]|nr:peptide chain release factor 3 [Chlamydiia bacterium]